MADDKNTGISPVPGEQKKIVKLEELQPKEVVKEKSKADKFYIVVCDRDIILKLKTMDEANKVAHKAAKEAEETMLIFELVGGFEAVPEKIRIEEMKV